jgi:peptide/nickel transport system substrate-binding protein
VRYADDLTTIVPNVAKSWEWNDDFTELTISCARATNGPTARPSPPDIEFWLKNLALDPNVIEKPKDYVLAAGEPIDIEVMDDTTFKFRAALAQARPAGAFRDVLRAGLPAASTSSASSTPTSTRTPTPTRRNTASRTAMRRSRPITARRTGPTRRARCCACPTAIRTCRQGDPADAGEPYLRQRHHRRPQAGRQPLFPHGRSDRPAAALHLAAGRALRQRQRGAHPQARQREADYKSQSLTLASAPLLLENQEKGDYTIQLKPADRDVHLAFNVTSEDIAKREVFGDVRFRRAMSSALNRDEMNETPSSVRARRSSTPASRRARISSIPSSRSAYIEFDPDMANAMLDEIGMVDTDGDGFRELPNGDRWC